MTRNGEFREYERVMASTDLRGVPAGTAGTVIMVAGLAWRRYRVRFDNGLEHGSLDGSKLARPAPTRRA